MSCNRQCFDKDDKWFGHEDCTTCSGKDDGANHIVVQFRIANWIPHALEMITKQQLENAARAMGCYIYEGEKYSEVGLIVRASCTENFKYWNPLATTTQGKADLLDLILALNIQYKFLDNCDGTPPFAIIAWCKDSNGDDVESYYIDIINGDKHAALAEAVVLVASQIWESNQ